MDDQHDLARYLQEVHTSDVFQIEARAGTGDVDLLALAKKRALDPSVFDEYPPFFFGGIISTDRWDSYNTRMGMTSLENYAKEAAAGVPYLRSHNTRGDPVGHTLTGTLEGKAVRADVYIMSDSESLPYIIKIRGAVVQDQSIGFSGGQWLCTICNRDMQEWWTADGCQHFLGMMYAPTDKKGNVKADKPEVMARAVIEGAHLGETSGVYAGATPGAMIDKARSLGLAGQLDQSELDFVRVRYKVDVPEPRRIVPVAKRGEKMDPITEEQAQELRETAAKETAKATRLTAELATVRTLIASANLPADRADAELKDQLGWLVTERARLLPMAEDGIAYRKELIKDALTEGARARGTDFKRETYEAMLTATSTSLDTIRQMRDDWKVTADEKLPKGRQTTDGTDPVTPTPKGKRLADAAFQS